MASNPPFQLEDQTDEDFFDKLVDDDDDVDFKVTGTSSVVGNTFVDGNESDDAKAFSNLSIGEVKDTEIIPNSVKLDDPVNELEFQVNGEVEEVTVNEVPEITPENIIQTKNEPDPEPSSDGTVISRSENSGVKEVGWSAFSADSTQEGDSNAFGSYIDFFSELGENGGDSVSESKTEPHDSTVLNNYSQYQDNSVTNVTNVTNQEDPNSSEYWENLYPGWKYDSITGQWYEINQVNAIPNIQETTDVSYLKKTSESVTGTVISGTTQSVTNWDQKASETVSNWNQISHGGVNQVSETGVSLEWSHVAQGTDWNQNQNHQVSQVYPSNMVFDPQYPGWYYDTITQEWCTLDSYNTSLQVQTQVNQNGFDYTQKAYTEYNQVNNQGFSNQGYNKTGSITNYNQQNSNFWQPGNIVKNESTPEYKGNTQVVQNNHFIPQNQNQNLNNYGVVTDSYSGKVNENQNFTQNFNQSRPEQIYRNQNSPSNQYSQQRSSAGRPPHALVTFGFGGKIILMKDTSSSFPNQNSVGQTVSVLNLSEVVAEKNGVTSDYFRALCQQSLPGPLTGGNVGAKELNKWIDERITNSESLNNMDLRKSEVLRLLLSLLKIACQYYGKLRSPFGTDTMLLKENDLPESAVAKLFASVKKNDQYGTLSHCLQSSTSQEQILATASEVQSLLVSGRKKDALLCAQAGQLWGPALVLAAQLGNQFYVDAVKQMALSQLVAGSPLRTLCLLIAGQPADVFSVDPTPGINNNNQQQNSMLDYWEENLAVITSNRTKDDELVLIHLGDSLWKERSDIIAAHICYLVAEANFEQYSDSARMCLIGADHWKFPRSYASPEAIQRTEIYEYSKVLGNSQFTLLPFQPYKLIYAHMLAEVGRMSDALKYCQAVLKSLKTGRSPEVETLRQLVSSLEERIKSHQQGGFSTNLAPAKLVGKLLNLFDSTAHRVVGGVPPVAPEHHHHHQSMSMSMSTSQSTMAISSLMPMEPVNELASGGNRMTMHNRSVSEPDFGRSPRQVDSSKDVGPTNGQGKAAAASRFGRFGFGSQFLQKTVGLVLKPRQDRQAKLGETNKFYYDEKLKRWVEEGAAAPAEEPVLAPPPMTASFQNGGDYNLKTALKNEGPYMSSNGSPKYHNNNNNNNNSPPSMEQHSSGIPPLPPSSSSNQFSARGRMGVRARYVDTFNQGGGGGKTNSTNLFQSPPPITKSGAQTPNPKFFVPSAVSAIDQPVVDMNNNMNNNSMGVIDENVCESFQPQIQSPPNVMLQRGASMDNMSYSNSFATQSRRTASWSGGMNGGGGVGSTFTPTQVKPLGEVLGMPMTSVDQVNNSSGSFGDLQEVEL